MSQSAREWRWVDPSGRVSRAEESELRAMLAEGTLPPETLLWRTGWAEWLPALRVLEFSHALGRRARPPVVPKLDFRQVEPPELPRQPASGGGPFRSSPDASLSGSPSKPRGAPALPQVSAADKASGSDASGASREPASAGQDQAGGSLPRPPMPTIDEDWAVAQVGDTLRPPVAVPPPPRPIPPADLGLQGGGATENSRLVTPIEELLEEVLGGASAAEAEPAGGMVGAGSVEESAPPASPGRAPSGPPPVPRRTAPSEQSPSGRLSQVDRPAIAVSAPAAPERAGALPRLLLVTTVLSSLATVLALVALGLVLSRPTSTTSGPDRSAFSSASAESGVAVSISNTSSVSATAPGCVLVGAPRRIAGPLEASIPVLLGLASEPPGVAAGFGLGPNRPGAVVLDVVTLGVRPVELEPNRADRIQGVVPLLVGSKLSFAIDGARPGLESARTIAPGLVVGACGRALCRAVGNEAPQPVWPLEETARITPPSAVCLSGAGCLVVFRSGGQSGRIRAGWLGEHGDPKSELGTVDAPGMVGMPAVGAGQGAVLVSFAARTSEDEHWSLRVGRARVGELLTQAQRFELPPGGPAVEAISPSATGLDRGHWLLQWTEGATGNRQVRAVMLGPDLAPIGSAVTVSPAELNSGQGAALAIGSRVVVAFSTITPGGRELWVAGLECRILRGQVK